MATLFVVPAYHHRRIHCGDPIIVVPNSVVRFQLILIDLPFRIGSSSDHYRIIKFSTDFSKLRARVENGSRIFENESLFEGFTVGLLGVFHYKRECVTCLRDFIYSWISISKCRYGIHYPNSCWNDAMILSAFCHKISSTIWTSDVLAVGRCYLRPTAYLR